MKYFIFNKNKSFKDALMLIAELCSPVPIYTLKSQSPIPQNVIFFGNSIIAIAIS